MMNQIRGEALERDRITAEAQAAAADPMASAEAEFAAATSEGDGA